MRIEPDFDRTGILSARQALHAWITGHAYDLWWGCGADRVHGGFHESLHLDGTPTDEPRRARLHPRQMFAYSHAIKFGWRGPAAAAVEHGLKFFLSHYPRGDQLFRTLVAPDGAPLDDRAVLYDQAFALLGFASAFATLGDEQLPQRAGLLHDRLRAQLAHPSLGFEESPTRSAPLTSNSHMHLLEASLAWMELDRHPRWNELASQLVDLALTRFIDSRTGVLREFFAADWQPMPGEQGGIMEPGHQFEWAWLLLRFRAHEADARIVPAALRLIEIGEAHGVDRARRAAINALNADFSVRDGEARLWPQCERIKAACIAAELTAEARYCRNALEATRTLMTYLDTPLRGIWRDRMAVSGSFREEPAPASSFYHIVGALAELSRVAGRLSQDGLASGG